MRRAHLPAIQFRLHSLLWLFLSALLISVVSWLGAADPPYSPYIAAASNEGEQAIAQFQVPAGFKVQLWAAEPLLANPVGFCFDERGRMFVAETFRQNKGVEDNEDHDQSWLDDDLTVTTLADRLENFKRQLGEKIEEYKKEHDRIRLLEDTDGDGKADRSTVFADGFNDVLEGTGASVLARRGDLWYTNIPNLWMLRDNDGDGQADVRRSLHYGYGVRVSFRGHDLHGLRIGPDGRLYFSVGDRGFNITTREGKRLVSPDRGAVLRCNLDGSELEVFASGLRNPQDLAFDQFGNLLTGDNCANTGDRSRCVQVVEGGDSGFRMPFQYQPDGGVWVREKWCLPQHAGQPAFLVPPIALIADGPSGLAYDPGVGLPEAYANHFFLCDFRGTPSMSGVRSFALKPRGASFDLVDAQESFWGTLATDVEFGPDCAMYVSDWVAGWVGVGKGRIYKITSASQEKSSTAAEVQRLIREGFAGRPTGELTGLLSHPHMQVRLEAQFALAEQGASAIDAFKQTAAGRSNGQLARLHAIWGLGQLGRKDASAAMPAVADLLDDPDSEVRAQAAKTVGDCAYQAAAERLVRLLKDAEPRVRFYAAIALGHMGTASRVAPLLELLRENADRDPYLRHAGVTGLVLSPHQADVLAAARDASPAVRMAVLLVQRRRQSADVARFLNDAESRIVEEAARAIYDEPIAGALPQLAALASRTGLTEPTLRRAICANFLLGGAEQATAVARLAVRSDVSEPMRLEALRALENWTEPPKRDLLLGSALRLPARDPQVAGQAIGPVLRELFAGSERVRESAADVAGKLRIAEATPELARLLVDRERPARTRLAAIRALSQLGEGSAAESAAASAIKDENPLIRIEARRVLARVQPEQAVAALSAVLQDGDLVERQAALSTLADVKTDAAGALLAQWLDRLIAGDVPVELQLDLLEAARRRGTAELQQKVVTFRAAFRPDDPLAAHRVALAGGNAERGATIFFENLAISCARCHKVGNRGGDVGPDLTKIGSQQTREYLLESLVLPDKQNAKGFDPVLVVTRSGKTHAGVIKSQDEREVRLTLADGNVISIPKSEIEEQTRGRSAMPDDMVQKLTPSDLRDLVEFLATRK